MARTPNTDARRAEITAAMLPVLARHGYEKATIQAIATQAGLAPGLIHYHFKSKQAILLALVQSIADFARVRFENASEPKATPDERLEAYLQARLGLGPGAAPELVAAWVMIGAEAVRQAEVREVYQQVIASELAGVTRLVADSLRAQRRDTGGAPALAAALIAMMEGAFQLSSAASAVMPVAYAAEAAISFARLSIAAAPRG